MYLTTLVKCTSKANFFTRYLLIVNCLWLFFFFFQAEDGIRDKLVTGVQTCALPIFPVLDEFTAAGRCGAAGLGLCTVNYFSLAYSALACLRMEMSGSASFHSARKRSEERRVGKEGRSRWSPDH